MISRGAFTIRRWQWLTILAASMFLFALTTCGGGGGSSHPNPQKVAITGVVEDGNNNSVSNASCSFVDDNGDTLASDDCDQSGRYQLEVSPEETGTIYCGPKSMTSLNLSTVVSTVGVAAGEILTDENITPTTTVAADIIRYEKPANLETRKSELILQAQTDPNLQLVVALAGRLFRAMLANNVNAHLGDDHSGGGGGGGGGRGDSGGVGGDAGDGADFSPLPEARCSFIIGDDLGSSEDFYPAALADFLADGKLDRPDLAALADDVSDGVTASADEIRQAFEAWFPDGLGDTLTDVADENGKYFLPIPVNLAGYVRCTPKDQDKLVIATYIPGRSAGEVQEDQDVNPATTVFAAVVAKQLDKDLGTVKENFLADIDGLQVLLEGPNLPAGPLTGVTLDPGTSPANNDVGLVAFTVTALYNTFYKNNLNVDFSAVIADLVSKGTVDPSYLAAQGVSADQAQVVSDAVDTAGDALQTDLPTALSTARINVTVMGAQDAGLISGAEISIDTSELPDVICEAGCGESTNAEGQLTLTLSGVSEDAPTTIPVTVSSVSGYAPYSVTTQVVAFATVDLDITLSSQCSDEDVIIGSPAASFGADGGQGSFAVTAPDNCPWSASTSAPGWITIDTGNGSGTGAVGYTISANDTASERTGTITVGQRSHTVTQGPATCTVTISPDELNFPRTGGSGSITVSVPDDCAWSAATSDTWLSITSGDSGSGDGAVGYSVAANTDSPQRDGTITVGGVAHAVHQEAALIPPTPDPMTWANEPHETSTTAIAMTASTATDPDTPITYQFDFVDSPTGGSGGTDSGWQSGTTYTDSGLGVNQRYGYRVQARDGDNNQTGWSSTNYAYTAANTPGVGEFSNAAETGIQAHWTANGNPSGTQYYCENTTAGTHSGWITATSWNSTGLTCGQSYSFRVRARNGDNDTTAWRNLGAGQTAACPDNKAPTPNPLTWATEPHETSTTAIAMTAHTATDPTTPITYQFDFVDSPTGGSGGTDSGWQSGTTYTDSGLSANHRYGYRLRARDGAGNATEYTSTSYDYTDIETPSGIAFGTITTSSIQARSTNTPSGLTRGSSGLIVYNLTQETNSGWRQNNNPWTSGSLAVNHRYGFYARARNGDQDTTGVSPTAYVYTRANVPGYAQFSNQTQTSIQANWTANGNPGTTEYQCHNITTDEYSGWTTHTYWVDEGLTCNSRYAFEVRARNGDNVGTTWRALDDTGTTACSPRIDQRNLPEWGGSWTNIEAGNEATQTFTPSFNTLTRVDIDVVTGNPQYGDDYVTVEIWRNSTLLGSASQLVRTGYEGLLQFVFKSPVSTTPGETLRLVVRDRTLTMGWKYGGNTYSGGIYIHHGVEYPNYDFFFQTWGY
jgi:hypothetical protein